MKIIKNIKDCWKHIPYTLKHRKALLETQKELLGYKTYYLHDMDKIFMYIFMPYLGTLTINKIHRKLNHHHVDYFRGINHVDKIQAICDWECARKTKPDKPLNAAETLKNLYPQYTQDFINAFVNLGLGKQLVETFGK